ncbi:MAG TPA: C25 family cysteine peptidase [Candidatus Thermoplasmatota archaeon]|nr:C25 family cysteine peptidase [Candidatus Thermoplasmatota archaeon]
MMKKIIGIFVSMLMISGALVSATDLLQDKKVIKTDSGTITVTIPIGSYQLVEEKQGLRVSIDDFGRLLIPGKPNLPSKIFSIAIPPGAEVQGVTFETKNSYVIPGKYKIEPCTLPRVIGPENSIAIARDQQLYDQNFKSVYGQDNPYPQSVGEVMGTGGYRKYNLVDVRVSPIIYYPLSGKIVYHPDITVTVQYTFPKGFSSKDIMIDYIPSAEQTAKEIILNYEQAKNWYPNAPGGRDQYDYVIITLDSLTSSVSALADWESAKGRNVNIVTTSWISTNYEGYDLAAKMRAFLLEKYPSEAWGIINVCLIGGYDDVPMRRTAQDVGYGAPETDYYYAELSLPDSQSWDDNGNHQYGEDSDSIDFQAEINVGRIPWSDPDTVQSICEKSAAYEQNTDDSFKKNILLLGAFFWSDTDNAVLMEYKTNPVNYPWMSDWTKTRLYEDAQSSYPCDFDLSKNNVESVWSSGTYGFVDWAGHGNPDACYEMYPSQAFVDEGSCLLLNDDYPAIIFADACSNSDTDDLNIGQAMLKQGGVGFLGATKVAYGMGAWNDPYDGSSQSLDCFFTTCVTSGEYTQGAAHQWSLREMYTNGLWYYNYYEMFEWGALWGNPDLSMGSVSTSNPPATPTLPSGPTHGVRNVNYVFSSSTSDPDGDIIYFMFNWDDGSSSTWLGPYTSGSTVSAPHSWSDIGAYDVVVKAKDSNGATSDWSQPHTITITLNEAPDTPTIKGPATGAPGESYLFKMQTTDNDGDNVYYYIDWGDSTTTEWIGPFNSGAEATTTHRWSEQGTYTVKVKAKDIAGDESDWGTMEIAMPFEYRFSFQTFLQHLFEMFPHMFPILRQLIG